MSYLKELRKELKAGFPELKVKLIEKRTVVEVYVQSGPDDMVYPDAVSEKYGFFPATLSNMTRPDWMTTKSWASIIRLKGVFDSIGSVIPSYYMYIGESAQKGYNK